MNRSAIERNYERLFDTITYQDYPIHFAGASLLLVNASPNLNAVISIYDSGDAVTWNPILFSTHNASSLLNYTLIPQALIVLLFTSCRRYVQFRTTPDNPDGVYFHLVQWPPTKVGCPGEYSYAGS